MTLITLIVEKKKKKRLEWVVTPNASDSLTQGSLASSNIVVDVILIFFFSKKKEKLSVNQYNYNTSKLKSDFY